MVAAGMWQYGNVGVAQFILVPCLMLLMMHKPHHSRLTAFRAPSVCADSMPWQTRSPYSSRPTISAHVWGGPVRAKWTYSIHSFIHPSLAWKQS